MTYATYDTIGKTYDTTRKADPSIAQKIFDLLKPIPEKPYLDLGCGSGNYTQALFSKGVKIEGIDISQGMLSKAREKYPEVIFHQGSALDLPFKDNSYFGATCILATHHIGNFEKLCREAYRIIKKGQLVIFTSLPNQVRQFWLAHYFPKMLKNAVENMASFDVLEFSLKSAGFCNIQKTPFFITNQLQDLFLYAGKYKPEIYLNPEVRAGISTFHLSAEPDELTRGLKELESDILSGKIQDVITQYENTLGDYLFISAEKRGFLCN